MRCLRRVSLYPRGVRACACLPSRGRNKPHRRRRRGECKNGEREGAGLKPQERFMYSFPPFQKRQCAAVAAVFATVLWPSLLLLLLPPPSSARCQVGRAADAMVVHGSPSRKPGVSAATSGCAWGREGPPRRSVVDLDGLLEVVVAGPLGRLVDVLNAQPWPRVHRRSCTERGEEHIL